MLSLRTVESLDALQSRTIPHVATRVTQPIQGNFGTHPNPQESQNDTNPQVTRGGRARGTQASGERGGEKETRGSGVVRIGTGGRGRRGGGWVRWRGGCRFRRHSLNGCKGELYGAHRMRSGDWTVRSLPPCVDCCASVIIDDASSVLHAVRAVCSEQSLLIHSVLICRVCEC